LLGIFQGKKAEYNKLILKSLVLGPKTTRQIAQYVYLNRKAAVKPSKPNMNEVKKIESVISRKNARLKELETKYYIYRKNNVWHPTPKGTCVALTQFNSIMEIQPYIATYFNSIFEDTQKTIRENPYFTSLFKTKKEKQALNKFFIIFKSPEHVQFLKDFTNKLIIQGLNLDKTNPKDFNLMLISNFMSSFFPRFIMSLIKR